MRPGFLENTVRPDWAHAVPSRQEEPRSEEEEAGWPSRWHSLARVSPGGWAAAQPALRGLREAVGAARSGKCRNSAPVGTAAVLKTVPDGLWRVRWGW